MNRILLEDTLDKLIAVKKGRISESDLNPELQAKLKRLHRCYELAKTYESRESIIAIVASEFKIQTKQAEQDLKDYPLVYGKSTKEEWDNRIEFAWEFLIRNVKRAENLLKNDPEDLKALEFANKISKNLSDFIYKHKAEAEDTADTPEILEIMGVFNPELMNMNKISEQEREQAIRELSDFEGVMTLEYYETEPQGDETDPL